MPVETFEYQFSTSTSEPPTGSQVRLNAADQLSATLLWLTFSTTPGQNPSGYFALLSVGDTLYLQDWDDATRYLKFEVMAPMINKVNYGEFSVALLESGIPLLAQKLMVVAHQIIEGLPASGRAPGDVLTINASGDPEWLSLSSPVLPLPGPGPCSWPISYASCGTPPSWSPEQQAISEQMAAELLWNWTGRGLGLCEVSIRPCRSECTSAGETFWGRGPYTPGYASDKSGGWIGYGPVLVAGQWFNITCGVCGDNCSCDNPATLRLPGPIVSVGEVLIDGVPLDPIHYRVDNRALLVRTDGERWPRCQHLGKPLTEEGTFGIGYTRGTQVPIGGQVAAGLLATEMFKALCNDSTCQLPKRVQSISRQGVTMTMLDTFEGLEKGRTGIFLVDSWISSVTYPPRPSMVFSPDIPRPKHRTTTWP